MYESLTFSRGLAFRRCSIAVAFAVAMMCSCLAAAQKLAITGATVIDGSGSEPVRRAVVLIEGERIAALGPASEVTIPDDAEVIDARGHFVIPGLIDANVHLYLNIDLESLIKYEGRYQDVVLEAAQIALKSGLTTVFDTWGPREALVQARDRINAGEAPGSRIYLAGNIIGFDGPLSADFNGAAAPHVSKAFVQRINATWQQGTGRKLMWMTPEGVISAVEDYAKLEVDFLKYGSSGHVDMQFIQFSPRVQKAIVDAGHRAGMTVQAHTTSVESLDMAIEAGVDIVTHGDITGPEVAIPDETIQKMLDRAIEVSILPVTQRRVDAMLELDPTSPEAIIAPFMKVGRENQKKMIDAGVTVLMSTDAGIENPVLAAESKGVKIDARTKLGEGHFNALQGLEELGLAPMEILKSATSNVAKAYGVDGDVGTIAVGKLADLVILDENPLKDAKNYRSIQTVIKAGAVIDIEALPLEPLISSMTVVAPKSESESE